MGAWRDTGTWTVKDEDGRLHFADCECVAADGEHGCRSRTLAGFATREAAEGHAAALETARGYACAVYPLQARGR